MLEERMLEEQATYNRYAKATILFPFSLSSIFCPATNEQSPLAPKTMNRDLYKVLPRQVRMTKKR